MYRSNLVEFLGLDFHVLVVTSSSFTEQHPICIATINDLELCYTVCRLGTVYRLEFDLDDQLLWRHE
jgi:hypothetical protein